MVGILRVKAFEPTALLYADRALELVRRAVSEGRLSHGRLVREAEERVAARHGFTRAVATNGAGPAMLAALAYYREAYRARVAVVQGIGYGAAVYALLMLGYRVVLADASRDALVADYSCLERLSRDADVLVLGMLAGYWHGGYIRDARSLAPTVLVDAAQAYGVARNEGGVDAVLSFHSAKPVGAGEGGMLLTGDSELEFYARAARDYGMVGRVHSTFGFNLAMTELQAAFIVAGDEAWEDIERRFGEVRRRYRESLAGLLYEDQTALEYEFNGLQNLLVLPRELYERGVTEKEVRMRLMEEYGVEPWGTSALNLARQPAFTGRVEVACGDSAAEEWYRRLVVLPNTWRRPWLAEYVSSAALTVLGELGWKRSG